MEEFCVDRVLDSSGIRLLKPSLNSSTCSSKLWMCVSSSPLQPCTSDRTSYIRLCICIGVDVRGGECSSTYRRERKRHKEANIRCSFVETLTGWIWNDAFTCLSHLAEVYKCVSLICQYPLFHLHPPQPGDKMTFRWRRRLALILLLLLKSKKSDENRNLKGQSTHITKYIKKYIKNTK